MDSISEEHLDDDVTIYDEELDEFFAVTVFDVAPDNGHWVLVIKILDDGSDIS